MMLHTKYQGSSPCGFKLEYFFFFIFHVKAYAKHVAPMGGAIFGPRGIIEQTW